MRISEHAARLSLQTLGDRARASTDHGQTDCIFDNGYVNQTADTGLQLGDRSPQITVTTSEAKRIGLDLRGKSLRLTVKDAQPVGYRVRDPQPDGTGLTIILLDALK